MKRITTYIAFIVILLVLPLSCTDEFEEINLDERKVTNEQLTADYWNVGGFFPQIQQMIYCNFNWGWGVDWPFQIMQNLNADIFSGYMMTPNPFGDNINNTTYYLKDGWNSSAWNYTYSYFMTTVRSAMLESEEKFPSFYATALILKVAGMHRISDQYGPIIYTHYGTEQGWKYDSQKDAYYAFFEDLEAGVKILTDYVDENPEAKPFELFDNMFAGDYMKWIKFANSLRLRLAIRISKVDPQKAKTEGEAALAHKYGVLENSSDEIAQVQQKDVYRHPLYAISIGWGDIKMGAPIESILTGYEDPRLEKYFLKTTDKDLLGKGYNYKGIRQGIEITAKEVYVDHSSVNVTEESPAVLMSPAEVYFLRAEGALRGWAGMGGSAQSLYEQGVQASMSQWKVSTGDYLSSTKLPAPYVDPKEEDGTNDVKSGSEYLNNVTPKWDESASNEEKLQRIITQKWIAVFPEGCEAWAEFRRTGYPKLFPVVVNNSQGEISTTDFVRRLRFSSDEKNANTEGYAEAVSFLKGEDKGGTRLWWDTGGSNF